MLIFTVSGVGELVLWQGNPRLPGTTSATVLTPDFPWLFTASTEVDLEAAFLT